MSGCCFCEKYNGYTNKPTWLYQLWASNDQGSYDWLLEQARNALTEQGYFDATDQEQAAAEQNAITQLADVLQEEFGAMYQDEPASLKTDLWSTISAFINWQEIAEYAIEEVKEE